MSFNDRRSTSASPGSRKGATFTHVAKPPAHERLSDFFNADRGHLPVHRFELLAVLERYHQAGKARAWYRRLWRWLSARVGDKSTPEVPAPQPLAERAEQLRVQLEAEASGNRHGLD